MERCAIIVSSCVSPDNNCGLPFLSSASSSPASNGSSGSAAHHGLSSSFANHPFTNTAFTISPLANRPSFSASAPCSVMSYPSTNGPMSLAAAGMATCVKPTPLPSSAAAAAAAGFVKVEGGSAYYGGSAGYGLAHAAPPPPGEGSGGGGGANSACSSSSSSFCLSSLPFSHESYQLVAAAGQTQTATGPLLAAVDANIRSFSTPTSAATIPYIACDQCAPSSASTVAHHPTVLYNWAGHHQSVPMGSTMLNHASFGGSSGLMAAHAPSPPPQCGPASSPEPCNNAQTPASGDTLQQQQEQENNTSSPHESGYYSSATSPAPTHHRYFFITYNYYS